MQCTCIVCLGHIAVYWYSNGYNTHKHTVRSFSPLKLIQLIFVHENLSLDVHHSQSFGLGAAGCTLYYPNVGIESVDTASIVMHIICAFTKKRKIPLHQTITMNIIQTHYNKKCETVLQYVITLSSILYTDTTDLNTQ